MKRFSTPYRALIWLLIYCLCSHIVWAADEKGLLWRIDGAANQPSYLLGTIHSDDARVTNVPARIKQVFQQADSFSGEVKMDLPSLMQASQATLLSDGQSLEQLIEPTLYKQTVQLLAAYGMPELVVQRMKPWAAAAALSLPRPQTGIFLDMALYHQAAAAGKRVYGLETIAEQVGALETMSQELQITMLRDAVAQHHQLEQIIEQLINAYLRRDLKALESISNAAMQNGDDRVAEMFNTEVVERRNYRMLERMQPRLREGNAFVAVGALHLPGDKGLLNLLRNKGYRVSPVY
ncbi:MAG: TraB/GumN family protein [Gammaproteobacteria bacterium]|nr:TraB/GumN family protein [Gammaproteobacteria bacterium]